MRIEQKLVTEGSPMPVSRGFMSEAETVLRRGLVPEKETSEYSRWVYHTPVDMEKVTAFGSGFISPAHLKGLKNAVDFYVLEGTEVKAPADGKIIRIIANNHRLDYGTTTDYWSKGNGILMECPWGEYVWLEHLQYGFVKKIEREHGTKLRPGLEVKAGDVIGISGNTGFTENPHVHMEVLKFVGDSKSKEPLMDDKNYITVKIGFCWDIPFDLYIEESRRK